MNKEICPRCKASGDKQQVNLTSEMRYWMICDVCSYQWALEKGSYSNTKRIEWNDYFMGLAILTAARSPDPNTQVGACIVSPDNKVVGLGYNGLPRGLEPYSISWAREAENILDTKYPYVVHAERNAILNSIQKDLVGCTLYTTLFPCNICAQDIIQVGITDVYFWQNKYPESPEALAAAFLLNACHVKYHECKPDFTSFPKFENLVTGG